MTVRLVLASAVLVCLPVGTAASAGVPFDDVGTLVTGVECVLFEAESGGLYVLGNYGDFSAGDTVRVVGDLSTDCVSACLQGDGCILNNDILDGSDYLAVCGTLISRGGCAILQDDADGSEYVLDQYGGFSVGQRVHVVGEYRAACGGECAVGIACIRNNSVQEAWRYCDAVATDPNEPEPVDEPDTPYEPETPFEPVVNPFQSMCGWGSLGLLMPTFAGLSLLRRRGGAAPRPR
jgi:hypothetical protein